MSTNKAVLSHTMPDHLFFTMLGLYSIGAQKDFVNITTVAFSDILGRSQQATSIHLITLEKMGYIARVSRGVNGLAVKMTEKGIREMQGIAEFVNRTVIHNGVES